MAGRVTLATVATLAFAMAVATAARADEDEMERGEQLFDLCSQCHGPEAAGDPLFLAPAIAGMGEWYILGQLQKFRSGARGTHFDDLSGMRMRPMSLTLRSEKDVAIIAKYVASLPRTKPERTLEGGDPARGAPFYALCLSCHGARGEGLQAVNGPALVGQSDWYMLEQMKKFRAGVRGGDTRDINGILMRPMALALPDEQAIKDVIAHIQTFEN